MLSHIVRSQSYCAGACQDSRYRKPIVVPMASIRSVPRWHISMMEASSVGLHIMWPPSADTAAAGIESGCRVPEYHGDRCASDACGGRYLGHSHSTIMTNCAATTPIVPKPKNANCLRSNSRKSGKPISAIAPPGSIANSKPMAARAATAVTTLTMAYLPSRVALPDLTPPDNRPSHYYRRAAIARRYPRPAVSESVLWRLRTAALLFGTATTATLAGVPFHRTGRA